MSTPTQSEHPWRASIRTGLAVSPVVLTGVAALGEEISKFVSEQFPGTPAAATVLAVSGFIVGLSILVNRIMLMDKVNAALTAIGLGPRPKNEA